MKFKIGDKVVINGNLYNSSTASKPISTVKNRVTYITRIAKGAKHPYNTTGDLGWMDEKDIKLYEEPNPTYEVEVELIDKDKLIDYIKEHSDKVVVMDGKTLKEIFKL